MVYRLQDYFEKDVEPPLPSELLDRGDFSIFVDGVNRKDLGAGLLRTAVPSAFPGEPEPPKLNFAMTRAIDEYMQGSPFDQIGPTSDGYGDESARSSLEFDPRFPQSLPQSRMPPIPPIPSIPPIPGAPITRKPLPPARGSMESDMTMGSVHSPSSSMGSIGGISRAPMPGMPEMPGIYSPGSRDSRPSTGPGAVGPLNSSLPSPIVKDHVAKKSKPSYSWNEVVDRENLGVRPGEVEILSKDFEIMCI